jgi:hypothetical protein
MLRRAEGRGVEREVHQSGTSNESEPRRYRWCPFCNELWSAARFPAICPLCEGLTLAYVGRLSYAEYSRWRRHSPLKRGVDLIEAALIDGVRIGLDRLRHSPL